MNKYLIDILKIQNSVILPGFGALMIANAKTGKIVFNPLLKFNDGTLAKYIAEKEGIDQQDALNTIAKFVREIETELSKDGTYAMFGFGKFYKDKDGKIDFEMDGAPIIVAPATEMVAQPNYSCRVQPKLLQQIYSF